MERSLGEAHWLLKSTELAQFYSGHPLLSGWLAELQTATSRSLSRHGSLRSAGVPASPVASPVASPAALDAAVSAITVEAETEEADLGATHSRRLHSAPAVCSGVPRTVIVQRVGLLGDFGFQVAGGLEEQTLAVVVVPQGAPPLSCISSFLLGDGDAILSVNGAPVAGELLQHVVDLIRLAGSTVSWSCFMYTRLCPSHGNFFKVTLSVLQNPVGLKHIRRSLESLLYDPMLPTNIKLKIMRAIFVSGVPVTTRSQRPGEVFSVIFFHFFI